MELASITNPTINGVLSGADFPALIQEVIVTLVNILFVAGTVIFFFMLLFGGIQWISSGGDQQKLGNAKAKIQHAIVGLIILLSSFAIIKLIEVIFGVSILLIDVGDLRLGGGGGIDPGSLSAPCTNDNDCDYPYYCDPDSLTCENV